MAHLITKGKFRIFLGCSMNRIFFYVSDSYNVILFVHIILPLFPLGLLAALASLTSGSSGGNNSTSPSGNSSGNGSSAAGTFPSLISVEPLLYCLPFVHNLYG